MKNFNSVNSKSLEKLSAGTPEALIKWAAKGFMRNVVGGLASLFLFADPLGASDEQQRAALGME